MGDPRRQHEKGHGSLTAFVSFVIFHNRCVFLNTLIPSGKLIEFEKGLEEPLMHSQSQGLRQTSHCEQS